MFAGTGSSFHMLPFDCPTKFPAIQLSTCIVILFSDAYKDSYGGAFIGGRHFTHFKVNSGFKVSHHAETSTCIDTVGIVLSSAVGRG